MRKIEEVYVIGVYDLEGHYLDVFDSINECADALKIDYNDVWNVCKGDSVKGKSYQFAIRGTIDLLPTSMNEWKKGRKKDLTPIAKYYKGKFVCVYNSITEAAAKNDINVGNIHRVLSGELKRIRNFEFKTICNETKLSD